MPPTNTQRRPSKEAPRPRHKSKPKFDLPEETGAQESPVGWVYRADEVSPPPPPPSPQTGTSEDNPVLMVGVGLFLIGIGTLEFVSRAVFGMIAMPARFAKGLLQE